MGTTQAMEAATTMTDMAGLDVALHYHLTANHYPPIPAAMIPVAKEAIEHAALGDYGSHVQLPEGVTYKDGSTSTPVYTIVESLHLEHFVMAAREEEL